MGRAVVLKQIPRRIVSLVPSQSELLHHLGAGESLVGITKFCVHPESRFKTIAKVGGTKQFKIERIRHLSPDLIIGNKEENDQQAMEVLMKEFPVWMSDVSDLASALEMIGQIGLLTGTTSQSDELIKTLQSDFDGLLDLNKEERPKVAYFIWRRPYMVAAAETFIHDMLERAGFENAFAHLRRYPEIQLTDLDRIKPDAIFLSSEPYPFKERHFEEFRFGRKEVFIERVDGELFSWYGSRLLLAAPYFRQLRGKMP